MSRNGSGTYNLPAGNPVVTGSTISSTWANNTLNDIATALTGSIAADGQTTPTGNLPMGGYNHTNVANATVRTQYASAGQVQDSAFTNLSSVSGTDVITATGALGLSAYVTGQRFTFVAAGTNTGASTLNINSIGAKSITKTGSTALSAGDIQSGGMYQVVYDGTQFQLLNPYITIPTTVTSFSAGSTGLTPSTGTTGAITLAGTLAVANGGTGSTSLTANNVLLGNGTSAVQVVAPGTSGNALVSNGTTWASGKQTLTSATAQATTSGTSITFSSIPSWVKRITVMFNGVSTNGTSSVQIQLGAGSVQTTGYNSGCFAYNSGTGISSTSGLVVDQSTTAASSRYGNVIISLLGSNIWTSFGTLITSNVSPSAGAVTLSGTLDRVVITTINGTDTFDAGSVNIIYE